MKGKKKQIFQTVPTWRPPGTVASYNIYSSPFSIPPTIWCPLAGHALQIFFVVRRLNTFRVLKRRTAAVCTYISRCVGNDICQAVGLILLLQRGKAITYRGRSGFCNRQSLVQSCEDTSVTKGNAASHYPCDSSYLHPSSCANLLCCAGGGGRCACLL